MQQQWLIALVGVGGALVAAGIGAAATIIAVRLQKPKKKIRIVTFKEEVVKIDGPHLRRDALKVSYEGRKVNRLVAIYVELENVGTSTVSDLSVQWEFNTIGEFIERSLSQKVGAGYTVDWGEGTSSSKAAIIKIPFLNPREQVRFSALATDDVTDSKVYCRAPELRVTVFQEDDLTRPNVSSDSIYDMRSVLAIVAQIVAAVALIATLQVILESFFRPH